MEYIFEGIYYRGDGRRFGVESLSCSLDNSVGLDAQARCRDAKGLSSPPPFPLPHPCIFVLIFYKVPDIAS